MHVILPVLLAFVGISKGMAQTEIEYRFSASLENGQTYMRIVIEAGSTCNGIFIERSVDSVSFEEIGAIPGICGSSDADVPYDFTDSSPVANHRNYYRIRFGDNGFSEVLSVLYIALSKHYKVIPNPARANVMLHFSNPSNAYYTLSVFNSDGRMVLNPGGTNTEMLPFSVHELLAGTYFFMLSSNKAPAISGVLVVD
jgi:hypothetical protein